MLCHTPFLEHLRTRGLTTFHRCWFDYQQEVVTFPIWSFEPTRQLVGYQRYNWREVKIRDNGGKYFTWLADNYKDRAAYGLDNCFGYGPLFVVEGVWDSLRVGNCHFDCLALLTCSPCKNLKAHLRQLAGDRPIVALCDNDANGSGLRLKSAGDYHFVVPSPYKDTNEMPHDVCFNWLTEVQRMVK